MLETPDITLRIRVLDSQGNFRGGKVDVEFKHRTLSEHGTHRGLDASREINIAGLRRAPNGEYQITVTPTDVFKPQSQFVNIPARGVVEIKVIIERATSPEAKPPDPQPETLFEVKGRVRDADGAPFARGFVRAVQEAADPKVLGEGRTDDEGNYTIRYSAAAPDEPIDLRVSVRDEKVRLLTSSEIIREAKPLEVVNLTLPLNRPALKHTIEGRILTEQGQAADQLNLRLYRHDFGGVQKLLRETTTVAGGLYTFPFEVEGRGISLEVRAVDAAGAETPLSRILHDLDQEENNVVNLVAPKEVSPLETEYKRMSDDVKPLVGEMKNLARVRETQERQDLTVLNRSTGWDARLLALAANAANLSADQEVGLSQEVLYGLFRAGLPSDKSQLAQVSPKTVAETLAKLRNAGIINLKDAEAAEAKTKFQTFALKTRLSSPVPGSRSTYGEMLESAKVSDPASREKFASIFLNPEGDGAAKLWERAAAAGIPAKDIKTLQQQGKLAFLTLNNHEVTVRLQESLNINDPVQLVAKDFYRADKWVAEIKGLAGADQQKLGALIPPAYEGEKVEDRLSAYAEDMARKVRLSYPTQVIGHMAQQDAADVFKLGAARSTTGTFLNKAAEKGFRLGQTSLSKFLTDHPDVLTSVSQNERDSARENTEALSRVYQITPSNEAMATLMKLGFTSAYDVTQMPKEVFLERYGVEFSSLEEADLTYRKAQQVSSVTYNVFVIAKTLDSQPPVYGISAPAEIKKNAKDALVKEFPTLESLFGSMDFCECEHCRSVLSPAAYLVDLLQFIDAEPAVWSNFLDDWKKKHNGDNYTTKFQKPYDALIERRPDLPHIALTCENTLTALPHIDIVNEILEYYVANQKLDDKAARDTGPATTAELLAEPQNVIAEAYEDLRRARYPLTLPFDLWLETVRSFSDYFETPLWQILETLRASDELFAASQPYDRAAIFIESLGLSPTEYAIFTNPNPLNKWHELYGFATEAEATTETDPKLGQRLDLNSAKALSRRLGITYKELLEIVKCGFVNPKLAEFGMLQKLGASVQDVIFYQTHRAFYEQNKDLLVADRSTLSAAARQRSDRLRPEEWQRLEEVRAFEQLLATMSTTYASAGFNAKDWLINALQNNAFDRVLVLADPDGGCNFDLTTLRYAGGAPADALAFLKINLFVRLWRKLGWTIEETDRALQAFVPQNAPFDSAHFNQQPLKTALIYLAHLKSLEQQLSVGKQARLKLITLWSPMATTGRNSLYAQLFLGKSILKSDAVFDDELGNYLSPPGLTARARSRWHEVSRGNVALADQIDPAVFVAHPAVKVEYDSLLNVQHLSYQGVLSDAEKAVLATLSPSPILAPLLSEVQEKAAEFTRIKGHQLALQGALGLTVAEMTLILIDVGIKFDGAELSLANISLLYRYGLLAKALKLTISDLITLKQLSGLEPFKSLDPNPFKSLATDFPFMQTMRFVEVAAQVKDSGLKIEDLTYLCRHRFDENGKYRIDPEASLLLLKTIADGVNSIRAEHAVPVSPGAISEETLQQKLGLMFPLEVVERLLSMMKGTVEFTATRSVQPADKLDPASFTAEPAIRQVSYNAIREEQKLTFQGVLLDAQKADLKNRFPSNNFAALLDEIEKLARLFFDNHFLKQKLRLDAEAGFLDDGDFNELFGPLKSLRLVLPDDPQPIIDAKVVENENIQKDNQTTLQGRRDLVANAFLPFLQQRLLKQFIVQTLTTQTGADAKLVESLLTDERLLHDGQPQPKPLLAALGASAERGLTTSFFASENGSGVALKTSIFIDADTGLKGTNGRPLKPGQANSARFSGYLEVPASGAYRFYVAFENKDARARLRFDHLPDLFLNETATQAGEEASQHLDLKAGQLYRFTFDAKLNGGNVRLMVQGESLPKQSLAQLTLYPDSTISRANHALVLLQKALQLAQSLNLSEAELRYLLTHAGDFGNLDLSKLPTLANFDDAVAQALFGQFLRLAGYARLKRDLAEGSDDLIGIFESNDIELVYALIAKLMRRDFDTVKATARSLSAAPGFKNELTLQRLWEALQIVERFGVSVASLSAWTRVIGSAVTANQRFDVARDLKEAIKARFEPESWQRVAQPIFDRLRRLQRDALVAHVMHQHGFARMEQLYEYFLIDPGMEPVVQTSRIRLAISSLQLFIQRILLNLETKVHPSVINARQWEWMKRYRVWEANRKIFLFPENWLEPEFRDDKTHLFRELEGSLLEGDVSSDLVEDAFLKYLKKLDELARLDIVAMHLADNADPTLNTLHVIGRTYSKPHKYFYRRYAHQMWTPWEPVSAEIEGDHLAPVFWRDRLYLFWVTFMDKPDVNTGPGSRTHSKTLANSGLSDLMSDIKDVSKSKQIEMQLHWSEYLQGEWSPSESGTFVPVTGPKTISIMDKTTGRAERTATISAPITVPLDFDYKSAFIHVAKEYENGEERGVFIHVGGDVFQSFYLAGRNSAPRPIQYELPPLNPYSTTQPLASKCLGTAGPLTVGFIQRITTVAGKRPVETIVVPTILEKAEAHTLLLCDNDISLGNAEIAAVVKPLFYQDKANTLFVEPSLTEKTIEKWEEWLIFLPEPTLDIRVTDIVAEVPRPFPFPDPENPILQLPVDPRSIFETRPEKDWLVNPGTGLLFNGELIGPGGRAGATVLPAMEAAAAIAKGGVPLNANAGSNLAADRTIVAADIHALEKEGLVRGAGGLNVISDSGLKTGMLENFRRSFGSEKIS